jgi:hypothetical protein
VRTYLQRNALLIIRVFADISLATLQGALGQARILGGTIGLSMATIIFNHNIATDLPGILTPTQLTSLHQSITTIFDLEPQQQFKVAEAFADSFNKQMRVCMYLSAAAVIVALFTWQKNPVGIEDAESHQSAPAEVQGIA